MDINKNKCLALGFSDEFYKVLKADRFPVQDEYYLLLINEDKTVEIPLRFVNTVICPEKVNINFPINCNNVVTCGMGLRCTVSFSSVGDDSAVLSVSRKIENLLPCEVRVDLKNNLSLYENIVYNTVRLLNT